MLYHDKAVSGPELVEIRRAFWDVSRLTVHSNDGAPRETDTAAGDVGKNIALVR